jgi:predicted nucleotidyltransferase
MNIEKIDMFGYEDYKQILDSFKQSLLERFSSNLISLVLFGSVARGSAKQESDIDLLIILKDAPDSYYKCLEPVVDIELKLRKEAFETTGTTAMFSSIILSKKEAMQNRNIFLDMLDASIILYDKGDFFKNRLKDLEKRLLKLGSKKVILEDKTWYWNLKPDSVPWEVIEL